MSNSYAVKFTRLIMFSLKRLTIFEEILCNDLQKEIADGQEVRFVIFRFGLSVLDAVFVPSINYLNLRKWVSGVAIDIAYVTFSIK